MFHRFLKLLALAVLTTSTWAQSQPETASSSPAAPPPTVFSRISGLFSGELPQLDPPGTMKLILRPHFGDLVRRDYMRVEAGLRWALNDRFELNTDASVYFTHGLGDPAGYGIGKVRFGSKYVFEAWPYPELETSFGLNIELPVGHPPLDMTDGHYHYTPTVVVQHHSDRYPRLTTFAGLGLDFISDSHVPGTFGSNQPHDDSFAVTAGGIYDVGQLKWTLTTSFATTAWISNHPKNFYALQPGVLWYVPARFTFNSKTQWIVGLSARTVWGPDGTDFSLNARLRAEITFRQIMEKIRFSGSK